MEIDDRMLECQTCGRKFAFTVREQEFFSSKGFTDPHHCPECRAQRKRERQDTDSSRPASLTGKPGSKREWTKVNCAQCGEPTEVPFKPTTGRPVYCRKCFSGQKRNPTDLMTSDKPQIGNVKSTPRQPQSEVQLHQDIEFDIGPLPEIEPAPDEESEITQADYIPFPMSLSSTPEEVNPTFENDTDEDKKKTGEQ